MPVDPTRIIGEILGEPAAQMRNPVNADYQCPHLSSRCIKKSQGITGPYPICSIWRWRGRAKQGIPTSTELVCICPKRFYEIDLMGDVLKHCWTGTPPQNPRIVHEIKMKGFGNVDFVVADIAPDNSVREFMSVELQAVDITGSCLPAYSALISSKPLQKKPGYGFNFANVYKRFVTQLIGKGFFHHHWGTKIVAVLQDAVYKTICDRYPFPKVELPSANIIFMVYKFVQDPGDPSRHRFELSEVAGTHHSNLQNAVLYKSPPSKEEFCRHIRSRL